MGNKFCKIKDENNTYISVDENNQPLNCSKETHKCIIFDYQKILDNPDKYTNIAEDDVLKETNVSCSFGNDGYVTNDKELNNYFKPLKI